MHQIKTQFNVKNRELTLHRFPINTNETLQAWDAGDEYVINYIEEMELEDHQNIVILNDHFGSLSCWLSEKHNVTMMSDSYIAQQATLHNLKQNNARSIQLLNCLDNLPKNIDLVVMQLPKSNRLLTWQLALLRKSLPENAPVIAVNKAKNIHSSTLALFEKHLGTTTTSLAKKKHRLVFSRANCHNPEEINPTIDWKVDDENYQVSNYANVYSGESLDLGARFMLKHIPSNAQFKHIIDLGCGNGVLSIKAGQLNPDAKITCVDESFMAVDSAKLNLVSALGDNREIDCIANNCLDGFDRNSADLILCNPPFHQQNTITDHIAWQMFCDAKHVLGTGGQLLVIGNRHLGYDKKLAKLFGKNNISLTASNDKFVILQATK